MRWWGWGDRRTRRRCPPHALGFLRETVGLAARPRPPVALEQRAPRARRRSREPALRRAARDRRRRARARRPPRTRRCTPPARAIPISCGCAPGEPEGAPDAVVLPARRTSRCARVLELCARDVAGGRARSAAARASSAASRRCAGEHAAVIALDMRAHGRRRSRSTASRATVTRAGAGMRAPALERDARRARAHARPLPAVLRVRLARRLRGDALGRAGLDRLRARSRRWCSGLRLAAPAGEIALPALPASAAGPGAAPAAGRLGGHARA